MTYKDMFDEAFGALENKKRRMTDSEFSASVRAKAKKNTVLIGSGGRIMEIPAAPAEYRPHKLRNAVFGIAGTAAVLTAGFFGLRYLNEHGGLKEGGSDEIRAGYSETEPLYTMPVKEGEEFVAPTSNTIDPDTLPDISEAYGKAVQFHDATAWLNGTEYDGEIFTARFSILYTGDDYENYSPEYVKLTVGTPIDYNTEQFSIEEVPEADGFSHRCTYSVPVKLEPLKAYAMGIEYLNTDGKTTQPIEADRQQYKFVYKPMIDFFKLPDITGLNIDDAVRLLQNKGIKYSVTRSESNETPENCVIRTIPAAGTMINTSSVIVSISVSSSVPSAFDDFAAAGKVYGLDLLDFGVGVKVHAAQVFGCEIIQASKYMENVQFNEDGTIGGEVPTTIGSPNESRGSIKPNLQTQTVIISDTYKKRSDGVKKMTSSDLEEAEHSSYFSDKLGLPIELYYDKREYPSEGFDANGRVDIITEKILSIAVFDDGNASYLLTFENCGSIGEVEAAAKRTTEQLAETEEVVSTDQLPEFPIAVSNGNGLYGEYLETPLTGDEAWELVKERGGIDTDYPFPYDKSIFKFTGTEFCIDYADCDVTALAGGTVEYAGFYYGWGNTVLILDENGHYWLYGHLAKDLNIAQGDTVEAGVKLGHTGSTGFTDHQHYAMRVG